MQPQRLGVFLSLGCHLPGCLHFTYDMCNHLGQPAPTTVTLEE